MFTGIVEGTGKVVSIEKEGTNIHFGVSCAFLSELKIDQSISHNGVCLTVAKIHSDHYIVTAIAETLRVTNLGSLKKNDGVNLERCMRADARFDGHIVQGHVDATAQCVSVRNENGSHIFRFHFDKNSGILVSKGSVCVNGVSLTVVDPTDDEFSVAIIPYTFEHTNFRSIRKGDVVNLEFDIVGKYISAIVKRTME
ncbi:MAG TPA: riboflavin synthase [Bacteroidia bacterium]|jgi:riboflavin synthase|nr:riboflavin synthase [Bacteroidia bacterium]